MHKRIGGGNSNGSTENDAETPNQFYYDLCQGMVAANIPWRVVNNKVWRNFLMKYTQHNIPDESTLRKNYLQKCYENKIKEIQEDIGENYVWVSVDETTDCTGRYIANLTIGKLHEKGPSKTHLLASRQLDKTNHATISRFVNEALLILWPRGNSERILLFVTDGAKYMIKAAQNLKVFFPNMLHITCLAHGVNRVAEKIRLNFSLINKLISSVKKIFLKAPLRVQEYRNKLGNIPLPPEPIITRWGTWINAALFYADNLTDVKEVHFVMFLISLLFYYYSINNVFKVQVIDSFDAEDAASIKLTQGLLNENWNQIISDLAFIKANFSTIPDTIKSLEKRGMALTQSMNIVTIFKKSLEDLPGRFGLELCVKFDTVLENNPDFDTISKISRILDGEKVNGPEGIASQYWSKFKFAPITSCDVERSFSAFKMILTDKRHHMTVSNLEQSLVVYCAMNYCN